VAIANDITHQSGAFGPREDAVFRAAAEFALEQRLPLAYLAANSGARVGLATEVRDCLQVGRLWGWLWGAGGGWLGGLAGGAGWGGCWGGAGWGRWLRGLLGC
jgi:hypothetical protein